MDHSGEPVLPSLLAPVSADSRAISVARMLLPFTEPTAIDMQIANALQTAHSRCIAISDPPTSRSPPRPGEASRFGAGEIRFGRCQFRQQCRGRFDPAPGTLSAARTAVVFGNRHRQSGKHGTGPFTAVSAGAQHTGDVVARTATPLKYPRPFRRIIT
jgi:hypothetical protein